MQVIFPNDDYKVLFSDAPEDSDAEEGKLAVMWEEKYKEELERTGPLEEVCAALREELDAAHKQRLEAFEIKMKPIIIKDGPSRKANYKIQAARLHYEIYALTQRLRHTTMRVEHEEQRRDRREREVRHMREEISAKKTAVTTLTKGIPVNKIEVRPDDQLPPQSFPAAATQKTSVSLPPALSHVFPQPSVAAGTLSAQQTALRPLPGIPNGRGVTMSVPGGVGMPGGGVGGRGGAEAAAAAAAMQALQRTQSLSRT